MNEIAPNAQSNPSPLWGGAGVGVRGFAARGPKARTPLSSLSPPGGERLLRRHGVSPRGPGFRRGAGLSGPA